MACTAKAIVKQIESWIGRKESDGTHKKIIDIYNSHTPRARGYKLKYTDAWCAGTVSAAAIACDATDICPIEVSCSKMISLAKDMGIWVENENCVPEIGWFVFYDWEDNGKGDNKGTPNHVGLCNSVNEKAGTFTVVEGNYSNAVKVRELKINGKYLRGFAKPKYTADSSSSKPSSSSSSKKINTTTTSKRATEPAKSFSESLAGTYKVTASSGLNVRNGAGTSKKKLVAIPKGTKVKNYGYYTTVSGVKWLYVQFTYKDVKYTGFCSKKYLSKV